MAVAAAGIGPALAEALRDWFIGLPAGELAQRLIAGVALDELPFTSSGAAAEGRAACPARSSATRSERRPP